MASETFISEFHSIKGVLIGERKWNVHKLLKNTNITGDEELLLDNLKPKTYLETLMYIDVLIYLKKTVELLEILRNGSEVCASKIVKQPWFFKEAFYDVHAEELVDEILPSLSFSVKMKILKKLPVVFPEDKMDKVFDGVLKRYGLCIATTVLPGCSSQKIEEILKNSEVRLWPNQLKIIYNKQPNLINVYLDVRKQQKSEKIFENNFLIYLAQNDPSLFWNIIKNHEINEDLKLGRRTTKRLIKTKIQEIVKAPKKYIKYFRQETLVRNLNKLGEFKELYYNLFPRNIEKLDNGLALCKTILKYYPKQYKYQLYTETFSNVMKENILSNLSCLDDNFLEFICDVELRETLAHLKYNQNNEDEYIKYYKPERCFSLIKEKINLTTSSRERKKLLCMLVKCCGINKDLKSLEKVLKYFCERHRNDDSNTRTDFLITIESNFKLDNLNDIHWKYVNEILTIQVLNNEYCHLNLRFRSSFIKYMCKNNRPEDDINDGILEYLKQNLTFNTHFSTLSDEMDSEVEKKILMQAIENLPMLVKIQKMESQKTYIISAMIAEIFSYNLRHPKNTIMIYENEKLMELLKDVLKDYTCCSYVFYNHFADAICKLNRNNIENEMLTHYWEKMQTHWSTDKVIIWYLKYDPLIIVEHIDKILKQEPYSTTKIWPKFKTYSHLNLDDVVIKYCLKQLDSDEENDKAEMVRRLSILAPPEYYIKIMEEGNYIPMSAKLSIEDQEAKNIYNVQQAFLKNIKNLKDPLIYIQMLIDKFCQGDYLKSSLIALYSAFYKLPENDLKPYLNQLSKNKAMSVKKHALNLACSVFQQKMIFEILNDFEKNEKRNRSLQKSMFSNCLKYFSRNPIDELFEKVIFYLDFLEEHDKESLNVLHTVNISRNYKPRYIQHILKLTEKLQNKDKEGRIAEFNNVISSILDIIDEECIQKLPGDFCRGIIQKYFLVNQSVPSIFSFVINVLIYHKEKIENFDFVFKILSSYKLQYWQNCLMLKERENIITFFKTFYNKACEKETTLGFVEQFSSNWEKIFSPIDTFEEYILLNILQFKKDSEKKPETYSKKIVLFSETLIEEFGQIVLSKFITVLAKSIVDCKSKERINLLSNMLKFKTTTLNCVIVIELILAKQNLFYKDKISHKYREIDSVLKEITDPQVRLYYNLYLRK